MAPILSNKGFPGVSEGKESACDAEDLDSIPGSGNSPGEGNGNPLHSSCLENPMDRGGDRRVHGMAKRWTLLSDKHFHFHCLIDHCQGCDNSKVCQGGYASPFSETIYITGKFILFFPLKF